MNKKTLCIVLGTALVLKFALALAVPLTPDESLHWMQGRNLAWGFRDHPPVTAFLSFVSRTVFGVSTPSARLFAILSTTLCSFIAYAILKEAGCSEKTSCRGGVMLQLMPIFAFGVIMVPAFPFTALVFATEYFLFRAVRRDRLADHLLWGFFLGVSVLSYYIVVTAALAAGVYFALDQKGRRTLASPRFWAGAALAGLIAAPNICWNIGLGTDSAVWFQVVSRSPYSLNIMHFLSFAAVCIIITGPAIILAAVRACS
ncbi:glycosyltransferase family 39 protein, partial [Planctomycetota bacterium]